MRNNQTPYIGVTDFTNRAQVERAKACIPAGVNRRLHVGAMTSYKVLNGIPTNTGWENIWLNARGLQELFTNDPEVYNVIHYADYAHSADYFPSMKKFYGTRAPTRVEDLLKAWDQCGPYVNAIQLDMIWPRAGLIEEFRHCRPQAEVILQLSSKAMAMSQVMWPTYLTMYSDLVDYVLMDNGMGKGKTFDPDIMLDCIYDIDSSFSDVQIAVAGGLGPETFNNMKKILKDRPDISCDAQGRLRPSHSAVDPLNMECVEQYIKGVCSLLEGP